MDQSVDVDPPRTILVADDEDHVRTLLQRLFERAGYRVLSASNGRDALGILADPTRTIHLLITDVSMPGLGGSELILEAGRIRPSLKLICLSARFKDAATVQGVHYVPKPFTLAGLLRKVGEVLR